MSNVTPEIREIATKLLLKAGELDAWHRGLEDHGVSLEQPLSSDEYGYGFLFDYALDLLGVRKDTEDDEPRAFLYDWFQVAVVEEKDVVGFVKVCLNEVTLPGGEWTQTAERAIYPHRVAKMYAFAARNN